jgi:predicted O-linked N-acetylglucosamine transferase (SPINDLY family)
LRIGYVSPDFREHAVGRFLLPLLAHHDKNRVESFGYAQVSAPDAMTQRLRASADHWRNIVGLSDTQVADLITDRKFDLARGCG